MIESPGVYGIDEVDKSLGHDKTQDEAHADDNSICRSTHPGRNGVDLSNAKGVT